MIERASEESQRLAGRHAIVTGAASGIGRAVVRRFAADGASVTALDRNGAGLEETASLVAEQGGRCHPAPVDLVDEEAVRVAVASGAARFGGLHIVAAVAGIELGKRGDNRVHLLDLSAWQRTLDSNLTGMFLTLKHGIAAILASGMGGSVVLAGSPCGLRGSCSDQHAYSASKAGVHGLLRPLAADYADSGIRVNCVVPGFIDTPLTAEYAADSVFLENIHRRIPARRAGRPEEVAALFSWLCSDDASYVTGAFFAADGGQLAL